MYSENIINNVLMTYNSDVRKDAALGLGALQNSLEGVPFKKDLLRVNATYILQNSAPFGVVKRDL